MGKVSESGAYRVRTAQPYLLMNFQLGSEDVTQRVHIYYYYGSRPQKTIFLMVLGT